MVRIPALVLLPLVLLAAACDDDTGPDPDDTGPGPDDTEGGEETGHDTGEPEEGCITVDGEGGYARLTDAIRLASEGSLIEICAGAFVEAVTVDKSVTIMGAGYSQTTWRAPADEVPFRIADVSEVTLQGIGVSSDGHAIEVEDATDIVLASLSGSEFGTHAIWARDVEGLVVRDSTFYAAPEGAILVSGGTAEITGCNLVNNVAYAVAGTGDVDLVLRDNTIRGTVYSEKSAEGYADGFGVIGDNAGTLVLENNRFTDNTPWAIYAQRTDAVSLSGDTVSGGLFGVYQISGDLALDGVTVTNPVELGIVWVGGRTDALSITGSTVHGDPSVVADYDLDDGVLGGIGLYAEGNDVTVSDSTFYGWNDAGAWIAAYDYTYAGGTAAISDTTFENNGRRGLLVLYLDGTATGVTVRDLRQVEEIDTSKSYYVDFPAAVAVENGSMAWTGGEIADNEGWGISNVLSTVSVSGVTFTGNDWSAFIDYQGVSEIRGNTFTASEAASNRLPCIWVYENTSTVIEGNLFTANAAGFSWQESTGFEYAIHDYGVEVRGYLADVQLLGNTFEDGCSGFDAMSSRIAAEGNTWTDYWGTIATVDSATGVVTLTDEVVRDSAASIVYCEGGQVTVDGLTATDQVTGSFTYDVYIGGDYEATETQEFVNSPISLLAGCNLVLSGSAISGTVASAIEASDSSLRLDTVTIDQAAEAGVSLSGMSSAVLEGVEVTGATTYGLYASKSSLEVSGGAYGSNGSDGARLASCTADVRSATFSGNAASGLVAETTTLAAMGNVITGNGEYGISCQSSSTITECGNDISGNAAGDNDGCDASCDTTP